MTFDWSISLGSVITALGMLGGGYAVSFRLGKATAKFEGFMQTQVGEISALKTEISEIQKETRQIANAMSQLAVQDERIKGIEEDVREVKKDIRELRHGEGFVLPIKRGAHEVR